MNFFTIDKRYVIIYFLNFKNSKKKREEEKVFPQIRLFKCWCNAITFPSGS